MKKIILILFLIQSYLCAQFFTEKKLDKNKLPQQFQEINTPFSKNTQTDSVDFYPLNIGDLWEYIVNNDDTLLGERMTYYSFIKEVIKDSLMENGNTYKQLKFCSCANSSNKPVEYFYHRKDSSGNVYEYIDGQDYLLFDFTKAVNETYPSRYENHQWKIAKKYTVTGLGSSGLNAVDFQLIDESNIARQYATVIENFGLTFFSGTIGGYSDFPSWTFYGAIINNIDYGELIGKGQQTNWNEYYPLHVGDVWKYKYYGSITHDLERFEIVKDTLITDTVKYFIKNFEENSYRELKTGRHSVERIDNSGYLYNWSKENEKPIFKFNKCVGDTFPFMDYSWLLVEKGLSNNYTLQFLLVPDLINWNQYYEKKIGLIINTGELTGTNLIGAIINGESLGDTTSLTAIEKIDDLPSTFSLQQNYPNPFNPSTSIEFSIPASGHVTLEIFDILGQKVITLINEYLSFGNYKVSWNSISNNNQSYSSGIYFYKLNFANKLFDSKKMVLIK